MSVPSALGADEDVADPHGVGAVALERALVLDVGAAVRRPVVDEQAVLEVLAGIGEVDAEALERPARDRRSAALVLIRTMPPPMRHGDVPQPGVAADDERRAGRGGGRRRPTPAR